MKGSVLATIAFHDILNYPLTAWEAFCFGPKPEATFNSQLSTFSFADALKELEELKRKKIIEEKNGFYFLAGRERFYEERIERMKVADEKWHNVRWLFSAMRMVPFIRALALSGSMGRGAAAPTSDIDLFVITEKNRIWTGRFFLTLFTLLSWRLRPGWYTRLFFPFVRHGQHESVANKICLHHYAAIETQLKHRNLYTATLHALLMPLWGAEYFERFFEENSWICEYLPNVVFSAKNRRACKSSSMLQALKRVFEFSLRGTLGNVFEKVIGGLQKLLIAHNPLTNLPGSVVVEERELAFHPNTRDKEILDRFAQKMLELSKEIDK